MSQAFAGIGTALNKKNPTDVSFVHIGEIRNIDGPTEKLDFDDVTNMDSPNFYKEYLPTVFDGGEVSMEVNYLPHDSVQQAVYDDFRARSLVEFQMVLPNSLGTWTWSGYFSEMPKKLEVTKAAVMSLKIKVTGPPTFTP